MTHKIRRFRPQRRGLLDDITVYEAESLYARARVIIDDVLRQTKSRRYRPDSPLKHTARAAALLRKYDPHDPVHLLALLVLQAPGAARAQREMDKRYGGYKNRQARLYELIDFNDTFVDTVLALPHGERREFTDRLKQEIDRLCNYLRTPTLDDKQYEAITHGLSREIAVYQAAREAGYIAHMTSRVQDAMGIDMVITDPETKKSINIDVKTHSSFHWRLVDLQRKNRIDEERRLECELAGFCTIRGNRGPYTTDTVLFRVATDRLGEIRDFAFVEPTAAVKLIKDTLKHHGSYIV